MDRPRPEEEYRARINRALDYMDDHLGEELALSSLAEAACFSRFHFHRVFSALTGETPGRCLTRLRTEKAANLLSRPAGGSVTEISYSCGFSSPAVFSRTFKERFGVTPTRWREERRTFDPEFAELKASIGTPDFDPAPTVRIEDRPDLRLAYIRHTGPYKGDAALFGRLFRRLEAWAEPRGLTRRPGARWLSLYHDDPSVTDDDKLRLSVGVSVPPDVRGTRDVSIMTVLAARVVAARFLIRAPEEYARAWFWLCGTWLPSSGYQPADGYSYEEYGCGSDGRPEEGEIVELVMPVEPL